MQSEEQKEKKNEERLQNWWVTIKRYNLRITGVPEGEEREKGTERLLK